MLRPKNKMSERYFGDFTTRTPRKGDFTEYVYTFADGSRDVISRTDLSAEVDDALYEEMKREANNNRAQMDENRGNNKNQDRNQSLLEIRPSEVNIEDLVINQMKIEQLREAVKALKPSDQKLIFKCYVQGKSNTLIAKEEGVTEGTIRGRLKRVQNQMKNLLRGC